MPRVKPTPGAFFCPLDNAAGLWYLDSMPMGKRELDRGVRPMTNMYALTKSEAYLEAGKINAAGGRAYAFYDRDMTTRLGSPVRSGSSSNSRRHWGVIIDRESASSSE